MADKYWVYVLRNAAGKYYIGLSEDVARRLAQHNSGQSKWTQKHGPWRMVWEQGPMPLGAARKLELLLKRQKGGAGFHRLTGFGSSSGS